MIMNKNCQHLYTKNLARFMIIAFILAMIPFAPPSQVEAAAATIPSGDYVIQSDGIFQLDNGYSGTISIGDAVNQPANVTLIGSGDGLACSAKVNIPGTLNNDLTLTIQNLKINSTGNGINIATNRIVNLKISGTCMISSSSSSMNVAAIHVPTGKTIVIDHTTSDAADELTVSSGDCNAGIGGGFFEGGGTITINGGTINSCGGTLAAGIGGGGAISNGFGAMTGPGGGMITINGGIVNATGGSGGAGIGGGGAGGGDAPGHTMTGGSGGTIIITGGTINAVGGSCGAGIGGGDGSAAAMVSNSYGGDGGTINISGGTITATGGSGGAGIGGGYADTTGSTTLTGGSGAAVTITNSPTIIATGSGGGEHIGKGCSGPGSGSLKDNVGNDMSYLRFTVADGAGIVGAAVTINAHDYTTNSEGVTGCAVQKNAAAPYSAAAAGYVTKSDTITPIIMNNEISISMTSTIATVASAAYTVSAGGTANETITGLTYNTSKAAFQANLSKGESHQIWDDSGLHNPVVSGDTLVITAQDGTTRVTYTISLAAFNVTYDGNGNTGGTEPTDGNNYEQNNTVSVLGNTGSLEKSGYTFAGWNTQADGSGASYGAGDTFPMPAANVILYARWTGQSSSGGGGGGASPSPVNSTTGQASVYPSQGGKISLGNDVVLNIPANALSGSRVLPVKIEKANSPSSLPSGFMLLGQVYSFSVDSQDHYQFDKPLTITFTFDPDKVPRGEVPMVHYYDPSSAQWVSLPGTVSGNTITVTVDHFTRFAILIKTEAAPPAEIKAGFTDISNHWAQAAIERIAALGAASGYPNGTFKPDANITRAEFVTILVMALKLESTAADKTFSDTANHWAANNIAIAAALGIVGGYTNDTFNPDDPITREEMALMAVKAAKLADANGEITFADNDKISSWSKSSVLAAVNAKIMKGYPDNTFKPQDNATRAEAVSVILNLMK